MFCGKTKDSITKRQTYNVKKSLSVQKHKILHNFGLPNRVGDSNNILFKSYLIYEIQMAFTNLPLATIRVVYVSNQNYCPRQCQYDVGSNMFPI